MTPIDVFFGAVVLVIVGLFVLMLLALGPDE
jgi:hypothetical protein